MRGKFFWILILGLAGLIANLFAVEIHGGASFHFGSIFALTAAITFGPLAGALAAAFAGVPVMVDGQVGLALLLTLEASAVGYGVRRRFVPLTADLLFWALGSPLLLAWLAFVGDGWSFEAWVPALHAPINGALCAVIADLLLLLWTTRVPGPRRLISQERLPLRRHLVPWLALVTLIPILAAGLYAGRERAMEKAADAEAALNGGSDAVARLLEGLISEHLRVVASVALDLSLSPTNDVERIAARLDAARLTYNSISTLLVADRSGEILIGSPHDPGTDAPWWLGSVAHRDYFKVPFASGRPYVSDVFLGQGYATNAIVGLSAPVVDSKSEISAIVEASMDVRRLKLLATPLARPLVEIIVIDRDQRVLFALGRDFYQPMVELDDAQLLEAVATRDRGRLRWQMGDGQSPSQSMSAVWRPIPSAGWQVIGMMPASRAQKAAVSIYLRYALGILVAIVLSSLFATAVALRTTAPLEHLVKVLRKAEADSLVQAMPTVGSTAPQEVAELIDDFGAMATRLHNSYADLRQSLSEREALNSELEGLLGQLDSRVQERTRELTESRQEAVDLQLQFRNLLDDIEAVVCEFDLKSQRFTFVSRRVLQILGYPAEALYEDRTFWMRSLPEEARDGIVSQVNQLVQDGSSAYSLEHPVVAASGEIRWLRNVGRVLEGNDGSRLLRCVMLDITNIRKTQEDQLRRRQLESVGTLAGGIAHDFNNLLTTILGSLSLARLEVEEQTGPEPVLEIFEQIEIAGADAQRLSHQLLTFARGGQPIRRLCRLDEMLLGLEQTRDQKFPLSVTLSQDLPEVVADLRQLSQVVFELIRNAEQAMPEGGKIEIEAGLETLQADTDLPIVAGPYAVIRVKDSGVGVHEDLLSKVFDPYFTTKEEGRGFGLATTYSIMKGHEGHISLQSTKGKGTTASLWVPAAEKPQVEEVLPKPPEKPVAGRILLMDDEPSVRLVAGRMLERLGWRVTVTADGAEALEAYRTAQEEDAGFDAVLTDLTVPGGMGGAETMQRLLRLDPQVRAVVCSGYSNDPVMASYREHGFVGVMTKPFSLADLRSSLAEAMAMPLPNA